MLFWPLITVLQSKLRICWSVPSVLKNVLFLLLLLLYYHGSPNTYYNPYHYSLLTLNPLASTTLISAGTLSPPLTKIRSPTTTCSALIVYLSPLRITCASCGTKFLKLSIILELLASWDVKHENNISVFAIIILNSTNHSDFAQRRNCIFISLWSTWILKSLSAKKFWENNAVIPFARNKWNASWDTAADD